MDILYLCVVSEILAGSVIIVLCILISVRGKRPAAQLSCLSDPSVLIEQSARQDRPHNSVVTDTRCHDGDQQRKLEIPK